MSVRVRWSHRKHSGDLTAMTNQLQLSFTLQPNFSTFSTGIFLQKCREAQMRGSWGETAAVVGNFTNYPTSSPILFKWLGWSLGQLEFAALKESANMKFQKSQFWILSWNSEDGLKDRILDTKILINCCPHIVNSIFSEVSISLFNASVGHCRCTFSALISPLPSYNGPPLPPPTRTAPVPTQSVCIAFALLSTTLFYFHFLSLSLLMICFFSFPCQSSVGRQSRNKHQTTRATRGSKN